MLGKTIKIKKEHKKVIAAIIEEINEARSAYRLAVKMHTCAEDALWSTLHELYPETEGFSAQLNQKEMEIRVKARMEE